MTRADTIARTKEWFEKEFGVEGDSGQYRLLKPASPPKLGLTVYGVKWWNGEHGKREREATLKWAFNGDEPSELVDYRLKDAAVTIRQAVSEYD